jgi:tellurite resistance protein TerC
MDIVIGSPASWVGFVIFVVAMLALDLGLFHRKAHEIGFREALVWSAVWVGLSLLFNLGIWLLGGSQRGLEFLTGYLIEKSLSIDNIFVFVVIFASLGIPAVHQHRVLFWGILSALVLRAVMIFAGTALLAHFHWLIYLFGAFLVVTGVKVYRHRHEEDHPESGWAMRAIRRLIPSTPKLHAGHFFVRENGRRLATPLFMSLLLIEVSDVIFAVDSIPAILAISTDPFIVFTSNIFAILGLRSLYFVFAQLVDKFRYLKLGLSGVLVFVGLKMLSADILEVPAVASLLVIAALIGGSVVASWLVARREEHRRTSADRRPEALPSRH